MVSSEFPYKLANQQQATKIKFNISRGCEHLRQEQLPSFYSWATLPIRLVFNRYSAAVGSTVVVKHLMASVI